MNDTPASLIERFATGDLPPEEMSALEGLLRTSPRARAELVEQCLLEAHLRKALAGPPPEPEVAPAACPAPLAPGRAVARAASAALLAALAACLLAAVAFWHSRPPAVNPPGTPEPVFAARIHAAGGEVAVTGAAGETRPAAAGQPVGPGQKVQTTGEESWATLVLPDATRVDLGPDSVLSLPAGDGEGSGRVHLEQGAIRVQASKQPPGRPLVFTTAHARVFVLGTRFRLYGEGSASRVELEEGKVKLVRAVDGCAIEVDRRSAVVATGTPQPLEPLPLAGGEARLRYTLTRAGQWVAFAPDGATLAGIRPGELNLWSAADGEVVHSVKDPGDSRCGLTYTDGGDALVALSQRQLLTRWDARSRAETTWRLVGDEPSRDGALSPDGRWAAVGQVERPLSVWSVGEGGPEQRRAVPAADNPHRVALSRALPGGGPRLAYSLWAGGIEVVDVADPPAHVARFQMTGTPVALALGGDGADLAAYSLPDGLRLWRVATGAKLPLWPGHSARVECLRFSPDGKLLAAGLTDGTARVWSAADGRPLLVLEAGSRIVSGLAFSPDSSLLATAGRNGLVKVWECDFRRPGRE